MEIRELCLKQGQGLNAQVHLPTQASVEYPPPGDLDRAMPGLQGTGMTSFSDCWMSHVDSVPV